MARRRIGMSNKQKFYRSVALMSAFFMLISCFVLIGTMTIGIMVDPEIEEPRHYCINFWTEDRWLSGSDHYTRGEKIQVPGTPSHEADEYFEYIFRGWDINGDNNPDIVPSRAFFDFDGVAVYQKKQIKPLPKSSSEPEDSEGGDSSNDSSNYFAPFPWKHEGED